MTWLTNALTSSIGRKLAMSLTGLFLVTFLFTHLSGNMLLFRDDQGAAFNVYSNFMSHNPLIRVAEIIMLVGFIVHIYTAVVLTQRNNAARPVKYVYPNNSPISWFSKNMGISGTIVLMFLLIHLWNFYWKYHYNVQPDAATPGAETVGEPIKDMYSLVLITFKEQWYFGIFYVIAMVLLAFHLNHGFESAFKTLGAEHKKYTPLIRAAGTLISFVVPILFASMPLYFMLFK